MKTSDKGLVPSMDGATTKGEKRKHMTNEPDVVRIKRKKCERHVEPAPASLTGRRFLPFLGLAPARLSMPR
jgi:hypothetical protein